MSLSFSSWQAKKQKPQYRGNRLPNLSIDLHWLPEGCPHCLSIVQTNILDAIVSKFHPLNQLPLG